tara:strand:+ start:22 stop:168 length:147 start_codon:yes stop_codon:yes gene_type:complete
VSSCKIAPNKIKMRTEGTPVFSEYIFKKWEIIMIHDNEIIRIYGSMII